MQFLTHLEFPPYVGNSRCVGFCSFRIYDKSDKFEVNDLNDVLVSYIPRGHCIFHLIISVCNPFVGSRGVL